MIARIFNLSLLLLLLIPSRISGQEDVTFEKLHLESGLSQSTVQCLYVDSRGLLWAGTQAGLNVFDGRKFTVILPDPHKKGTISFSEILDICEDANGNILVSGKEGIDILDIRNNEWRHIPAPKTANQEQVAFISSIRLDRHKEQVLFSSTSGAGYFDPVAGTYSFFAKPDGSSLPDRKSHVGRIFVSETGDYWFATREPRIYRVMADSGEIKEYDLPEEIFTRAQGLESFLRFTFWDYEDKLLVAAGALGLFIFDPVSGSLDAYSPVLNSIIEANNLPLLSLAVQDDGIIWLPTYGAGLIRLKSRDARPEFFLSQLGKSGPRSNHFADVIRDPSGILWAGSVDSGLIRIRHNRFESLRSSSGFNFKPTQQVALSVTKDSQNRIWMGSLSGLDILDLTTRETKHLENVPGNGGSISLQNVTSIVEYDENSMLIGGYPMGLVKLDKKSETATQIMENAFVVNMFRSSQHGFWIASATSGLYFLDLESGEKIHYLNDDTLGINLAGALVQVVVEDSEGTVWIGTSTGLYRFSPAEAKSVQYTAGTEVGELQNNEILSILLDPDGTVWVGTSGGLHHLDPATSQFDFYSMNDGLPDNTIYALNRDNNGRIWVSTNQGLAVLDPTKTSATIETFDSSDGLPGLEFNQSSTFLDKNGTMLFGAMEGIAIFHPEQVMRRDFTPPILIQRIQAGDKSVLSIAGYWDPAELEFDFDEHDIRFEFAALDYSKNDGISYQYKLDGYDSDWKNAENLAFANYTNLPPGKFIFKVKATNTDGVWNDSVQEIAFRVKPAFWQTWWFYTLLVMLIGLLISAFFIFRLRVISRQRDLLSQRVEEATIELKRLATIDELTGISNRRHFVSVVDQELSRIRRYRRPVAFLMLDIDEFKLINDTHGHFVGDLALQEFVNTCKQGLRDTDIFGRMGGEEFAVMLIESDLSHSKAVAERLRKLVEDIRLKTETGQVVTFTVSIGLAEMKNDDESIRDLLKRADDALLQAKNSGRNQVVVNEF